MADTGYRFQQPGTGQFYHQQYNQQNHHQRHLARNGSPVNGGGRSTYANDTPSPSRSPVSQAGSHNPYTTYNQTHMQGQNMMMNGAPHQRYMQMGMGQKYQHQSHHQHHGQQNHHQQQNHVGNHGGMGHQHTFSSGTMSNATPHFTPSSLHNGGSNSQQLSEHYHPNYQHQMQLVNESRQAQTSPHHHCKKDGGVRLNRIADQSVAEEEVEEGKEERNRVTNIKPARRQDWDALDCSGQGMRSLSPALFNNFGTFLKQLYLDHNRLTILDSRIGQLRALEHLDISGNLIRRIPEEIGMLVNLKVLLAYDNPIDDLPQETGHLFRLETLGIEGTPIVERMREELAEHGTKAMVKHLREQIRAETMDPPNDRDWLQLDDTAASEVLSVVSYNILCDRYATTSQYGYTPSEALSWDYRSRLILEEINAYDADIVCLQEVDRESFDEFFRRELALKDYRGVFWPKSRAKTMAEKEARLVDGCATFFKTSKYHLLDKQLIDFANTAINRPDMKGEHNTFNRVMPRDHIAVACFLENRVTGSRLMVANTHIFWDPAFADVKLVQTAIMMEQLSKFADKWSKWPACTDKAAFRHSEVDGNGDADINDEPSTELGPSLEYSDGTLIPLVICGDFNSAAGTGVHDLISNGSLPGNHADLENRSYGRFTRDGMTHPFKLKSAYNGTEELSFTNYVPHFSGVLDYIWYSTNALQVRGLLGNVDAEYLKKVPGFPNHHFPSDHLPLKAVFAVKQQKAVKMEGENGVHKEWERRS